MSYDWCTNSCCCFVACFASLDACPYCKQPCFKSEGQTLLRTFHYLPIGPQLKALYLNEHFSELLQYHGNLDLDGYIYTCTIHSSSNSTNFHDLASNSTLSYLPLGT